MPNPRHAHLTTHIQVPRSKTPGRAPRGALTAASSVAHGVTTAPTRTDRLLSVFQTRLGHFHPSNISLNGDESPRSAGAFLQRGQLLGWWLWGGHHCHQPGPSSAAVTALICRVLSQTTAGLEPGRGSGSSVLLAQARTCLWRGRTQRGSFNCGPAGEEGVFCSIFCGCVCAHYWQLGIYEVIKQSSPQEPAHSRLRVLNPCLHKVAEQRVSSGPKSAHSSLRKEPGSGAEVGAGAAPKCHEAAPVPSPAAQSPLCPPSSPQPRVSYSSPGHL